MTGGADGVLTRLFQSVALYFRPRLLIVLVLGYSSGLPYLLTAGVLNLRLRDGGVDLGPIGLFAIVGLPYTLKFLWAPLLDHVKLPILTRSMGLRRSWLMALHLVLIAAISLFGVMDPSFTSLWLIAAAAVFVAFLSATQDVVIDAYRVELLRQEEFGAGAVLAVQGFRLGAQTSKAAALFLAYYIGWELSYAGIALSLLVAIATILAAPEPAAHKRAPSQEGFIALVRQAYLEPLREFLGRRGWVAIILFVLLFKFGDALLSHLSELMFYDIGIDTRTIGGLSFYGFGVGTIGAFIGGSLIYLLGIGRALVVAGLLQAVSNLGYWYLVEVSEISTDLSAAATAAIDWTTVWWVISFESFASGLGLAAFVAFLMSLCDQRFTAAQYAFLTSLVAFSPRLLVIPAGYVADAFGWANFCLATAFAAIPGLLLLALLLRRYPETWRARAPAKEA